MSKVFGSVLLAAATLFVQGGADVEPVGALSCAPHPDGSPEAIASGSERLATERAFFDLYDRAVLGRVTGIQTVGAGQPDYGATTLTVDVVAVLGEENADREIRISSPDPGWMAGYPYENGTAYFIPLRGEGPEGQPNYSFVCDPITQIDLGIAPELRELAADAGIPFAAPTGEPDDDGTAASGAGSSNSGLPLSVTAIAALAAAATVVAVLGAPGLLFASPLAAAKGSDQSG